MGAYYKACCDELHETIDAGSINNAGNKHRSIGMQGNPFGPVVIFALTTRWSGRPARLINDEAQEEIYYSEHTSGDRVYRDVTKEVLEDYNADYGTELKYTP